MKTRRYYLRKIWKMDKLPEWLMFFTVLIFSILAYITTQDSQNIANESNYIANETRKIAESAIKISENALEVSKNVYTILELEKNPKIVIVKEPYCHDFNSYRNTKIKLKNIGGLNTNCVVKFLTKGLNCFSNPYSSIDYYLFKEEKEHWKEYRYKSERKLYEEFVNFSKENGKQLCQKDILVESKDLEILEFQIYTKPYFENNSTVSFKFEVSCENPIIKENEIIESEECKYKVTKPIYGVPFASFIEI